MRRLKTKRIWAGLLTAVMIAVMAPSTALAESSSNYSYDTDAEMYYNAPVSYEVEEIVRAGDLEGVESLNGIDSLYVTDNAVYISTSTQIIITDLNFRVKHIIDEYTDLNGKTGKLSSPAGMFVKDDGTLYVCEPSAGHILVFDKNYKVIENFGTPEDYELSVAYSPNEIVVDSLNRMYVVANNVYEGILELNSENEFQRYYGETTVSFSALDLLWRQLATEEQLSKQSLWLPTGYSSMAISNKGFVYATISSSGEEKPIRMLNVNGTNILAYDDEFDLYPVGDIVYSIAGSVAGPSMLISVDVNDYGMYTVLDSVRNRVFTYDDSGNMLFVFGGSGDKEGCFMYPVCIRLMGDKVLVADRSTESITVMSPTNYGQAIIDASKLDYTGDLDAAAEIWQKVLEMNPNYELAYRALGNVSQRNHDYDAAENFYKQANYRTGYSKAYAKTRDVSIRNNFGTVAVVAVILIAVIIVVKVLHKKKRKGTVS